MKVPSGFSDGGSKLWKAIADTHELDASQLVQLEEACRAKDRLDKLDRLLRGELSDWASIVESRDGDLSIRVDSALDKANATANLMKQLLAALRLPDEASGKRPQRRGGARGSYKSSGAKVSSLEAARSRASS